MPIVPQLLLTLLTLYWSWLTHQLSEIYYARLLERCPHHLLVQLAEEFDLSPIETGCAAYQHGSGPGAPATYTIAVLVRCLLVKYLFDLSLREMEFRLYSDLLVRWFVGLALFGETPNYSTLERFEQWVITHQPRLYFDTVLAQVDTRFPHSRSLSQTGDTYALEAHAAEEDLVPRLRHTARALLEAAVQSMPALLSPTVSGFAWHALFGPLPERQIGLLDAAERQQRLETVVLAASDLQQRFTTALQSCSSQSHPDVRLWLGYLGKILYDEVICLAEPNDAGQRVRQRTSKEQRADPATAFRLVSATDPEATYRVHGPAPEDITFGYNVQVSAAQDYFIRETQAYTGATPDQTGIAPLLAEQRAHQGACPPKLIYDQAAGAGKTRAEVEQASAGQTLLVAKIPPSNAQSDRFGPYDFRLSPDGQSLTCPAGKVSTCAYRSQTADGRDFSFCASQCWQGAPPARWKEADRAQRCPLWEQCRDHRQGPARLRKVFISDYRQYVLDAKAYNQTEQFQVEMQQRPLIERVIFELTHYCGARHCRRRGLGNADWQAKMCATVYNIKLWLRKLFAPNCRMAPTD